MLRIYLVFSIFCCLTSGLALAQTNPLLVLGKAQKFQQKGEYESAILMYKQVLATDSGFVKAYVGLVESLYQLQNYQEVATFLGEIEKRNYSQKFNEFWCYKADLEWILNKNDQQSTLYYKQCKSQLNALPDFWNEKQKQLKKYSKVGAPQLAHLQIDSLRKIELKRSNSVFSPCFLNKDSVVFIQFNASSNSFSIRGYSIIAEQEFDFTLKDSIQELTGVYSMFLDTSTHLAVLSATKADESKQLFWAWVHPKRLTIELLNQVELPDFESAHCIHPQFVIEGRDTLLYFASNKEFGEGGFDLYLASFTHKGRNKVTNLGRKINTPGNEISPQFIDNELFYASDFGLEFNGFNVYKAQGLNHKYRANSTALDSLINSDADETFIRFGESAGLLTSNRNLSTKDTTCCMQLFYFQLINDSLATNSLAIPVDSSVILENELLALAPTLYFHNDQPNPNSTDSTTSVSFDLLYKSYTALQSTYQKRNNKQQRAEIETFFTTDFPESYRDLYAFTNALLDLLKQGKSIELTIKGYASALAKSDYNKNLTLRRIESLINYLSVWNGGLLQPYIANKSLTFTKIPYGESKANQSLTDSKNSIYSIEAILDRRIEVIAVEISNE